MKPLSVEWMSTGCKAGVMKRERGTEKTRIETSPQEDYVVNLYPRVLYQEFRGFGAAITEAAGSVLNRMPPHQSRRIMDDYFSSPGLGYTWVRVPIDSCDFSLSAYTSFKMQDQEETVDSESFIAHDQGHIITWLHESKARIDERKTGPLKLYMVAWSPPEFMKSNRRRQGGGSLCPEFYGSWARYLCRYVQAYEAQGFSVTFLGIQNEPNAAQLWDSCVYTAQEEKEFLENHLYPELQKHNLGHVGLSIWDHNREGLFERVLQICSDTGTDIGSVTGSGIGTCSENGLNTKVETKAPGKIVDAAAFHWYSGDHFEALELVRREFPELQLIFTEGCVEYKHFSPETQLTHAQMYGHHIIGDLNHGANAWLDWNLVLNKEGGPNYAGNLCDAPILCNLSAGTYEYRLSYHYLEHFAPWIVPGSRRIGYTRYTGDIELTAWKDPDDRIVTVMMNTKPHDIPVLLRCEGTATDLVIPGDSIMSVRLL